jgi:hypothetical protein
VTDAPSGPGFASTSLRDFLPLSPAETLVLQAAARGEIAKIAYRRPRAATPDTRLRAAFLAFVARGGGEGAAVLGPVLQIVGACVVGRLNLADASLPRSLWLYRCTFDAAPRFDRARVRGSLTLVDAALPGFQAEGCRIDGDLALNAGCHVDGAIQLTGARIGRDVDFERLRLRGVSAADRSLRQMLVGDAMRIGGHVSLQGGLEATGEVRFVAAQIGGNFRASAARLTADIDAAGARGVALNLDRVRIGGEVMLDNGFSAAGTVRLQQARIRGDLDGSGAAFDTIGDASWGEHGSALQLDRARIGGALVLLRLQGALQGASLIDARVGSLVDDGGTWGHHHALDGFAYTRFGSRAPVDAASRVAWLGAQGNSRFEFDDRPEPWRRAIRVLRRMGHAASADAVAIGRERHLRKSGRVGAEASPAWRWAVRLGHDAHGFFAGYGHRPQRLLIAAAVVWLLCAAAYGAAAARGGIAPAAAWAGAEARFAACRPDCARLPAGVPVFEPVTYSLDALLPLADLRQARHWVPARGSRAPTLLPAFEAWSGTPTLQWLVWLEAACGWALALTALAAWRRRAVSP